MKIEGALHELRPQRVVLLRGVNRSARPSIQQKALWQQPKALPEAEERSESLLCQADIPCQHLHACMGKLHASDQHIRCVALFSLDCSKLCSGKTLSYRCASGGVAWGPTQPALHECCSKSTVGACNICISPQM